MARSTALFGLALLAGLAAIARARYSLPEPLHPTASEGVPAAGRAMQVLERLLGDDVPHPSGSPAIRVIESRIVEELRLVGYTATVSEAFACSEHRVCGRMRNILARLPGKDRKAGTLLLGAHYDSVAAGPGAYDDGLGVAVLIETARALQFTSDRRADILFLFSDGEEPGTVGAEAFVHQPELMRDVRAFLSVDGSGAMISALVTQRECMPLVEALAAADRPFALSFARPFSTPGFDDSDVLAREHMPAATLGPMDHALYHSPLDAFSRMEPGALQHALDNAHAMTLALSYSELPPLDVWAEGGIYFDLLAWLLVSWPHYQTKTRVAFGLSCALLALALYLRHHGRAGGVAVLHGALVCGATGVAAGLAVLATRAVMTGLASAPTGPDPGPAWLPLSIAGLVAGVGLGTWKSGRANASATLIAGLVSSAVAGAVVGWRLPEIAYVWIEPALLASPVLAAAMALQKRALERAAMVIQLGLTASICFGIMYWTSCGFNAWRPDIPAFCVAILIVPLVPFLIELPRHERLRWLAAVGAIGVLSAVTGLGLPRPSALPLMRSSLRFHQDADGGAPRIVVSDGLAPSLASIPGLAEDARPYAWSSGRRPNWVLTSTLSGLPIQAPELEIIENLVEGDGRRVRAVLRSPRGARIGALTFPPRAAPREVKLGGVLVPDGARWAVAGDWATYSVVGLGHGEVSVELLLGPGPSELVIWDHADALPASAWRWARLRDQSGVPFGAGDSWLVSRRVQLP